MLKIENVTKTFNPGTVNEKVALKNLGNNQGLVLLSYTHLWHHA